MESPSPPLSPVLVSLPETSRPGTTACATCPAAVWFVRRTRIHCYCRVMHVDTFTSERPDERVLLCDGLMQSSQALLESNAT